MIEWFGNIGQMLPSPCRKAVTFSPPMMTSHVSNTNKKRYNNKVSRNMGVDKSTDDAMIVRDIIASRTGRRTMNKAIDIDYNNMLAGTESYRDTSANSRRVHRRAILLGQKLYNADDLARLSSRSSRWSKDQAQLRANCRWM